MLSINMRIFKTVLLIACLGIASVRCLPVDGEPKTSEAPPNVVPSTTEAAAVEAATSAAPTLPALEADTTYYDQRQNGSENYRIHVDGVVLVFAPVEALLLAGASGAGGTTTSSLSIPEHGGSVHPDAEKPDVEKPSFLQNKTEPASSKTIHRPPLRLAHLLAPFLRRLHPEHSVSVH